MKTDFMENINKEKIYEFDEMMIKTAKANNDSFEFAGKYFDICSDGICVQTLICGRILYRINMDRNNDLIHDELFECFRH